MTGLDQAESDILKQWKRNVTKACIHFKNVLRKSVNRDQPTVTHNGQRRGLSPSKPNDPLGWKKVRGDAARSLDYEVVDFVGRVGSGMPRVRYLVLGTGLMDPRNPFPFNLQNEQGKLNDLLSEGFK